MDEHSESEKALPADDDFADSAGDGSECEPDDNEGGDSSQFVLNNDLLDENDTLNDVGDGEEAAERPQSYPGLRQGYAGPTVEALRNADFPLALFFFLCMWRYDSTLLSDPTTMGVKCPPPLRGN
ncbi:hypothetical protein DVH05_020236 [Phytophthora capsici]|nr:hypothetical protein DVH05_020236 [Phytophthora capsici]